MLLIMISQEVYNKKHMLPSEETLLMAAQLQRQPGNQNSLVLAWSLAKEQRDIHLWSLSGANLSSEQTKLVVKAMGTPAVKCLHH